MKAFYLKQSIKKDFTRTFEESVKMMEENPETFIPETAEMNVELESIDIPDHLSELFKEKFKDNSVLKEEEVMSFLEVNK
jgi:hypothetical protein